MVKRRITPAAGIIWEGIIWWAEISGGYHNSARKTPSPVINTHNFKARTTAQTIVEQGST